MFHQGRHPGPKTFAVAEAGAQPSLLESFLIDEKRITLALLVSRTVQRLNGQKWRARIDGRGAYDSDQTFRVDRMVPPEKL